MYKQNIQKRMSLINKYRLLSIYKLIGIIDNLGKQIFKRYLFINL